ncbi:MAG: sensor histidine kinase, partial [Candidatus Brocadiales bacterium]
EKERILAFASDGFIRDSLESIVHIGAFSYSVVDSLNNHLIQNKKPLDPHILEMSVTNMDGKVVAATNETLIGNDISGQEVFLQVINGSRDRAYVSQPIHIPYLQADCIFFAALVTPREGGDAIGVIINTHILAALSEITISRAGMGATGEVYLVNKDRLMLTESRFIKGAPLKQVVDTEPIRKIASEGKEMTGIYPDYRGVPIVGSSAYIPEYGWTLLAEIDEAEAFASIRTLGIIATIIGVVSAAVVTIVGIIFAFSTARPIRKLIVATDKFKDGDLKFRAEITRSDEIGLLAYSFNDMANELEKTITEQKRAARILDLRAYQQAIVANIGIHALAGIDLQALMDEAVTQACRALNVDYCKILELLPGGSSLLLRAGKGWMEGLVGQATVGTEQDSQAGYTLLSKEPVIVEDLRTETRFNTPQLLHDHGAVSGASVIIQGKDTPYGVFGVHTTKKRKFTKDDIYFLQAIANVLGAAIERKRMIGQIETSLKEKDILLREIHHRVKNNMQVIISMLMLQSGHVRADNIDDILKDSQSRINAMALVHEKLYQTKDLANINFHEYTKHLTNDIFRSFGSSVGNIELKIDVESIDLDVDTSIHCGLIMNELISNALKYAFPYPSTGAADSPNRGEITITMRRSVDSKFEIDFIISDNGIGMPEDLDFRNTKTLGLHLVNILVKQLDGEINLNKNKGTEFQIKFNEKEHKEMV